MLSEQGISFAAQRSEGEEQHDFFASADRWCRPVMTRTGPDGGLWIADMYRYMIEHPEWLPSEGKAELLPHYRLGEDRGRIYRVVSVAGAVRSPVQLDGLSIAQLVAAMDSSNDWQRDKVQQMLIWRGDTAAIQPLVELYHRSPRPQARVQALWTLAGLGALEPALLIEALRDEHPRVRQVALRLAEDFDHPDLIEAATRLADDSDTQVRLQLALSCGQWSGKSAGNALASVAASAEDDPLVVAAVLSSAIPHIDTLLPAILQGKPQTIVAYRQGLLRQALGSGDASAIGRMFDDALTASAAEQMERLGELLLGLERVGASLGQLAASGSDAAVKTKVDLVQDRLKAAMATVEAADQSAEERLAAAMLLSRSPEHRPFAAAALGRWLQPQLSVELQSKVIAALAQTAEDSVPGILGAAWPSLSPQLRAAALTAWLTRTAWTVDLLQRIERREILTSDLEPVQQARLKNHPDQQIAQQARELFTSDSNSTAKEIVQRYRGALELAGDPTKGEAIFRKLCVSCHRRGDEGQPIGPDLATVVHHSSEKLLTNILDPNVDIQPGYQVYNCLLTSGEVLSGILIGETANSLTILSANGTIRIVGRDEIEELKNLNISLMPEGLHENLTAQDLADLISLLKQPAR